MSLERKDIRAKLDGDVHAALVEICALEGIEIGEFIERLVDPAVRKRVHDAIALGQAGERQGFSGIGRDNISDQSVTGRR